ncbi:MAG: 4Fe-4S binding protein [Candidatus Thermoplasmatota archaeon]|nr:4Fe-4S binding protein [Candidatus Thermoplasmatota archaeon]
MKEYEKTGIIGLEDLQIPSEEHLKKGIAITECVQEIPCNPCVDACPVDAISMETINALPVVDYDRCTGCGRCVGVCPGLAIFVVKTEGDKALITLPYEFLHVPEKEEEVAALDREGKEAGMAVVKRVIKKKDNTCVITIEVSKNLAMTVRNIKVVK